MSSEPFGFGMKHTSHLGVLLHPMHQETPKVTSFKLGPE